jgi:YaiO family outer membrane protein
MTRAALALLLAAAAAPAVAAEVEASYGQEHLTQGFSDWRSLSLGVAWEREDRARFEAGARGQERFGRTDAELRAGAAAPIGPRWTLAAEASASPTHEVAPAWTAALETDLAIGGGFVASARGRWSRYRIPQGPVDTGLGSLGLERYFGTWRAGGTGYAALIHRTMSGSARLFLDRLYGERSRAGISAAAGRELSVTEDLRVAGFRTWTVAAGGVHELGARWAVTWELGVQHLEGLTTRSGGRLGIRLRT